MNERPILMSAPMVLATLDETKGQTRRLVKGEPLSWLEPPTSFGPGFVADPDNYLSPYGYAGDVLWVRENFRLELGAGKPADSEGYRVHYEADGAPNREFEWGKQHPSIHLPRWACRVHLDVTEVRIERLHAISPADAIDEGVKLRPNGEWMGWDDEAGGGPWRENPVDAYADLWDHINGEGAWALNPWVWVIVFKRRRP